MPHFPIPRSRRLTMDVLHWHRKMPICPHDRLCDLTPLRDVRQNATVRISWSLLFIKAYALMAEKRREFRQCLMNAPLPHIYEHPHTVSMMALEREYRGERWLFWARFQQPENTSLIDLQEQLTEYQQKPVEQIFKKQLQLSAMPTPLRRAIWWWNLHATRKKRAKRAGTCFLSTLAAKGVEIQNPPAFHTGNLTYGPFDEQGRSRVTLSYDHRLMDGSLVADALTDLETLLNTRIAEELAGLSETGNLPETIAA